MEKQIEKSFECPASQNPWEAECEVFANGKYFCPYAALPYLAERIFLPTCPHFTWVKR